MLKLSKFGFDKRSAFDERFGKLERLCADLSALGRGQFPTPAALEQAPVIHNWRMMVDLHLALYGEVRDHPVMPGSRKIMTSELMVDGRDLGWVRTASRYYLLGRPLPPDATFDETS